MEGYIHEPTHYYYLITHTSADTILNSPNYTHLIECILKSPKYTHLIECIRMAKKLLSPCDIYNSEGIIVYSLPIHEF